MRTEEQIDGTADPCAGDNRTVHSDRTQLNLIRSSRRADYGATTASDKRTFARRNSARTFCSRSVLIENKKHKMGLH